MSIFGKIKSAVGKNEEKPKAKAEKPAAKPKKEMPKAKEIMVKAQPSTTKITPKKRVSVEAHNILREPHISEKATDLSDNGKYIFKVFQNANKIQIKNAVSALYGVNVKEVNIINIKSKSRKMRNVSGHKPGYKKAVVMLQEGQKIEILPH